MRTAGVVGATDAPPRLRVERLGVAIGETSVLHDVSLSVEAGQVVALVGASGSGKTMTGLALLDLLPAAGRVTAGTARLDDEPIDLGTGAGGSPARTAGRGAARPLDRRGLRGRSIAMIFQQPRASLHPLRPVGAQLLETIRRHGGRGGRAGRAAAAGLLETAGFARAGQRLGALPHELSGGECQRVMIALALAGRPRVLFADEPTTALDVLVQGTLLERIRGLARTRGMGVVLVTHDLRVVAEVADAAFVLDAGRLVEAAPCADLFDAPRHPATRRLLAATGLAGSEAGDAAPAAPAAPAADADGSPAASAAPGIPGRIPHRRPG